MSSCVGRVSSCDDGQAAVNFRTVEDLLDLTVCRARHESDVKLYTLHRGLLTLEQQFGKKFSDSDYREIFMQWHTKSKTSLDPAESRDTYFSEIHAQTQNSQSAAPEPISLTGRGRWLSRNHCQRKPKCLRKKATGSWCLGCFQLQILNTAKSHSSCPGGTCQKYLRLKTTHEANKLLRGLEDCGIIKCVEKRHAAQGQSLSLHVIHQNMSIHHSLAQFSMIDRAGVSVKLFRDTFYFQKKGAGAAA